MKTYSHAFLSNLIFLESSSALLLLGINEQAKVLASHALHRFVWQPIRPPEGQGLFILLQVMSHSNGLIHLPLGDQYMLCPFQVLCASPEPTVGIYACERSAR